MHRNFRDCKAWIDENLPLSTTSDEAAKLYDACVSQYVEWYNDPSLGGIEKCCAKLKNADTNFVMGHVLENGLSCIGTGDSVKKDEKLRFNVDHMCILAHETKITERERKHVNAVKLWSDGYLESAVNEWEDILNDHPTDMLAIKMAHDTYFYLGKQCKMRDSVSRVINQWNPGQPLYSYLLGMHAFGLVETHFYNQAEKTAKQGLEMNENEAWSTHALCHVYEMNCRPDEGISFISKTLNNWMICDMLACHNFWHWALYHIEKNESEAAVNLYDNQIGERMSSSGALLDIVDACSLLLRLEMEGIDVGSRWEAAYEVCRPHLDDHILVFNDVHVLMAILGAKKPDVADKFMESVEKYISDDMLETNQRIMNTVGKSMCLALISYKTGDYDSAIATLYPIRHELLTIGGSDAQRDIFNLFLIHACLKSGNPRHHGLARALLMERKSLKPDSLMTERLMAQCMIRHDISNQK